LGRVKKERKLRTLEGKTIKSNVHKSLCRHIPDKEKTPKLKEKGPSGRTATEAQPRALQRKKEEGDCCPGMGKEGRRTP